MRGFSKAIVAGNVTRDPEMRTTAGGAQVCSFALAVNRVHKDAAGNQQEQVSFIDCVVWGRPAEIINQYVHKGTGILVSGRLDQRSWDDKATGQRRYRTEVVVEDFTFLGAAADAENGGRNSYGGGASRKATPAASTGDFGGDIAPEDVPEESINLDEIPF